jgi:hypothetical protein
MLIIERLLRSLLFWDATQRRLVGIYRRCEQPTCPILKEQGIPWLLDLLRWDRLVTPKRR